MTELEETLPDHGGDAVVRYDALDDDQAEVATALLLLHAGKREAALERLRKLAPAVVYVEGRPTWLQGGWRGPPPFVDRSKERTS